MFDLANDRLSYSDLLKPKAGYTLEFAVGMTYSLDLEALLGVPVSLGLFDEIDETNLRNPLYVLEAIRKSADQIALFCNAGNILMPQRIQSVYSLLENSVFQIKCKGNFHPKIWVIKYSHESEDPYINLLVMSRNLTFDSSIDISVALHGSIGTEKKDKHQSLADFLQFVAEKAEKKKQQVLALAEDVLKVASFEVSHPFEDYDFFPIGIPGYPGNELPLFENKNDLFAVSPFLSDDVVQRMTDFKGSKTLVTRKESVTPAIKKSFEHVYVTKEILCDNEFQARQDIHAKLYYSTTWQGNYLYIGSANASENAFGKKGKNGKNIECLLRLKYKLWQIGFKKFSQQFIPEANSPYEELTALPEQQKKDKREKEIDKAIRDAVDALKRAEITADGAHFSIFVEARSLKTNEPLMIAPLQRKEYSLPLKEKVLFSGMLLRELSEFFVLSLDSRKVVVKIRSKGMPKERDTAIFRSIIDSKAQFIRYLTFMLSGDLSEAGEEIDGMQEAVFQSGAQKGSIANNSAIYEQMLRVVHQNPSKLKAISDMIRRLDPEVVGEDFLKMYRQFEIAAKKVKK